MTDRGSAEASGLVPALFHMPGARTVKRRSPKPALTIRPNVNEWVVRHHQLVEVELVGKPFAFCLVENPLVVIVSVNESERDQSKHVVICLKLLFLLAPSTSTYNVSTKTKLPREFMLLIQENISQSGSFQMTPTPFTTHSLAVGFKPFYRPLCSLEHVGKGEILKGSES